MAFKITYSITPENMAEIDAEFEKALEEVKASLGRSFPAFVGYAPVESDSTIVNTNPADTTMVLSRHGATPVEKMDEVMELAASAQEKWRHVDYKERARILRKASDLIHQRQFFLSAVMALEVGKNRVESLGEVQESVDMIQYYVGQFEENKGYFREMGGLAPNEKAISILRPYGVFAVIEPFNFPMALAVGAITGALICGNSAVFKIASATPWSARNLLDVFRDAGVPEGVIQMVTGGGLNRGKRPCQPSPRRRRGVYRKLRGGHEPGPEFRNGRQMGQTVHHGDGREKPRHHLPQRRL